MIKPISPQEIGAHKAKVFPPEVLQIVNDLIAAKFTDGSAVVKQCDIMNAIVEKLNVDRAFVFSKGWLNFEEVYRDAGWEVYYDKPAYYENYEATFTFKAK